MYACGMAYAVRVAKGVRSWRDEAPLVSSCEAAYDPEIGTTCMQVVLTTSSEKKTHG